MGRFFNRFTGKGHTEFQDGGGETPGGEFNAELGAEGEGTGKTPDGGGGGSSSGEEAGENGEDGDKGGQEADKSSNSQSGEHWSDAIEALKGKEFTKKFDTPEAMVEHFEQMSEKIEAMGEPVTDPSQLSVNLPEGVNPDTPLFGAFKQFVVEQGVGKNLADMIMNGYVAAEIAEVNKMHNDCVKTLKDTWGNDYDTKIATCNETIGYLNGQIPGLGEWATSNPNVGSSPVFAMLTEWIARSISEDTAPAGPGGGNPSKAMSTEDFLGKEVFGGK